MLRHVRLGRLQLNTVKDWVLDYPETSKYPRLFVKEGDREAYLKKFSDAHQRPPDDHKCITDALNGLSHLVLHFAQSDKGLMDYGLDEGPLADEAEDALASPACTPEQAKEIRKWLSAIAYYVPSTRISSRRGLPGLPGVGQYDGAGAVPRLSHRRLAPASSEGQILARRSLAKVVTLYLESQINEAGARWNARITAAWRSDMPAMATGGAGVL